MYSSLFYTFSPQAFDRKYEDPIVYPYRTMGREYDTNEPSNKIKKAYLCTSCRLL
jgi:hypothetical protein